MAPAAQLVLLRHGQSTWNLENRFTGWTDVDLTPLGAKEAAEGGQAMKAAGFQFDRVYTSLLTRAIRTMFLALGEMGQLWLPVTRDWRLNERHYGALQGLNKSETAAKFGEEQVKIWRRSYGTPPPPLEKGDERHPSRDRRYAHLPSSALPLTESLKDTVARVVPMFNEDVAPALKRGERVLIVAHGNSLRALVKHLDKMSEEAILELNIPTGIPLQYELNSDLSPKSHSYLADEAKVQAAAAAVANQGKK